MKSPIYYLPGQGGRIGTGLGAALSGRGMEVAGREITGEFRALPFQAQIDAVAADLTRYFWSNTSQVIGNSYGCYLFLHAQILLPPYPGRVLLLSPIVGKFSEDANSGLGFIPPRAEHLLQLALAQKYPVFERCEIHVGELDWQSNPSNIQKFAQLLGINVTVVPGGEHRLDKIYVNNVLDRWLTT